MNYNQVNRQIRARSVRLIDQDGQNVGVVSTDEALAKAQSVNLDLVAVSGGDIPVCKIIDYNKFKYDKKSKQKTAKSKNVTLKELVLSPNIGQGDLDTKINRGKEFIEDGHMVKFIIKFIGRQKMFPQVGQQKLKIIESELSEIAKIEKASINSPDSMYMIFMPK